MKKQTKKTKGQRVRGIVMMSLICIMLLSAATYAWFTLSNTAKVANMTLTVGNVTGLQIAEDTGSGAGTYGASIDYTGKIKGKFLPATTLDGKAMLEPVYNDEGAVSSTKAATKKLDKNTTSDGTEGYYYETSFYLKALGANASVKLKDGTGLDGTGVATGDEAGTYVLESASKDHLGCAAIRISLSNSSETLVYEPNNGISVSTGTRATDSRTSKDPVATTSLQKNDGSFTSQSQKLTLVANTDTKITMRMWIEGSDVQCVNEIAANELAAQLQFTTES